MVQNPIAREERLGGKGVSLWLRYHEGAMICSVLNISRSGIACHIGEGPLLEAMPEIHAGSVLKATLRLGETTLVLALQVRRIAAEVLGCSFLFPDDETQRRFFAALSPRFVSRTISQVSPKSLAQHLRYAYFGADFWFLAFKEPSRFLVGNSEVSCTIAGGVVAVTGKDFMSSGGIFDPGNDAETHFPALPPWHEDLTPLPDRVRWLIAVLDAWADRPEDAREVMERLRSQHGVG